MTKCCERKRGEKKTKTKEQTNGFYMVAFFTIGKCTARSLSVCVCAFVCFACLAYLDSVICFFFTSPGLEFQILFALVRFPVAFLALRIAICAGAIACVSECQVKIGKNDNVAVENESRL